MLLMKPAKISASSSFRYTYRLLVGQAPQALPHGIASRMTALEFAGASIEDGVKVGPQDRDSAMMTTEIKAAMSPYSIAVTPLLRGNLNQTKADRAKSVTISYNSPSTCVLATVILSYAP